MPYPGQVFYLPRAVGEDGMKGNRPCVLLSLFPPGSELVTLAYGSTKPTDAYRGAESVLVVPESSTYRGTGLHRPTYIYPSRLVSLAADALPSPAGLIIDEMSQIREALRRALGLGTGVTAEANTPGANRRGRLVELSSRAVDEWDVRYGVVLTAPMYSRTGFQQALVPVLDQGCEARALDVVLSPGSRFASLGGDYENALLGVTMVSTFYQPEHISRYLDLVIDPGTMRQVDAALVLHFGL